jgi:hypothetical protein
VVVVDVDWLDAGAGVVVVVLVLVDSVDVVLLGAVVAAGLVAEPSARHEAMSTINTANFGLRRPWRP